MLELNVEIVKHLIDRAHEFYTEEPVDMPAAPAVLSDDWEPATPPELASGVAYSEFKSIIMDLEPDQQQMIVALMWLGRGDFTLDEWELALAEARRSWTTHTADYLISTPLVSEYLEEGLALHGYAD